MCPRKDPNAFRPDRKAKRSTAHFEDGDEPHRCRAKSKAKSLEAGKPVRCGNPKQRGYEVCGKHGAKAGAPIKHGRRSRRVLQFREALEEAKQGGNELFDLRRTLAVLSVGLERAEARVEDCDTAEFRKRANALFQRARAASDPDEMSDLLGQLGELLEQGVQEDEAFGALVEAAERFATRQEKAWSIKLNAANAINARDLEAVLGRIADIIISEVPHDQVHVVLERIDVELLAGGTPLPSRQDPGAS